MLAWAAQGNAGETLKTVKAPPLHGYSTNQTTDLGVWDAAFACDELDCLVLRQGEKLFSLPMSSRSKPVQIATIRQTPQVEIVAGMHSKTGLWLFCQSRQTAPFALEVRSGKRIEMAIPGVRIPGEHAPDIQSHVLMPHAEAAILMVAGGDRETWPREGNRPVYFWIGLRQGKLVRFPIGWDLDYFSSDQTVAVFEKPQEERFQRRPLQAVDVRTGLNAAVVPNRREGGVVPFDWTDTQRVKPVYVRRPETGDTGYFAGVSLNGRAYRFGLPLNGVHYLSTAKEKGGFIGLRLRREGESGSAPATLWFGPLKEQEPPVPVADGVTDFEMLQENTCVFVTTGHGPKGTSSKAFVYDHTSRSAWDVLEGADQLPPLDPELAGKEYVEDKMTVRLVPGYGTAQRGPFVLCLFSHRRGEMRALTFPLEGQGEQVKRETWNRAILVAANGRRPVTGVSLEEKMPDAVWFHNSGNIIVAEHDWTGGDAGRRIQLRRIDLLLGGKPLRGHRGNP